MGFGLRALGLTAALAFAAGCGGSNSGAPRSADSAGMTPAEASAFLAEAQAKRGAKPPSQAEVTSVEELVALADRDEVNRFAAAGRFLTGKTGVGPLTLHATLELLWSDSNATGARVTEELAQRAEALAAQLEQKQASGQQPSQTEQQQLEQAKSRAAFMRKAQAALDVLAREHLKTAGPLVEESVRQFPRDPSAHRVVAFYALLTGDWDRFDGAMEMLKDSEQGDAGMQYLRALEANKRFVSRPKTRDFLARALALKPNLVRAQAKLVLIQENIDATYAELQKLRTLAPDHALIGLVGEPLTAEYELAHALDRARQPAQP